MKTSKGFTLVEIMMVVILIGVITAAAFVFLRGGLRAADVATESSVEGTTAQLAAAEIESFLDNAGYPGNIFRIDDPVLETLSDKFTFISNTRITEEFGLEDEITITNSDGAIIITDGHGENLILPVSGAEISFAYTDAFGEVVENPASMRTVNFTITMASGREYNGSSSPYNLELTGLSNEEYRTIYAQSNGHLGRWEEIKFYESFEIASTYAFHDEMEGGFVWEPIILEDFESAASWANNWESWLSNPGYGRIQRLNDPALSYEGNNCLALDCWKTGLSTNMGIWTVDLSDYSDTDIRLRFHWREANDQLDYEDGVFLPTFTSGSTTEIDFEGFSGFSDRNNKDWTYWTNDYGRIVVSQDYPTDGNYLNMDSRRTGSVNECRVMNSYDLSSYSTSSDVWLQYDFCNRGDENNAGDFIGVMDGSIQGDPVAQVALSPASYPNGSWISREVDLDDLAPAGYDWSDFRIVFAQEDNDPTTSSYGIDGISIDNVRIIEQIADSWDLSNRMLQAPESFPSWEEGIIDLTVEAAAAGIPFSSDFKIGFSAANTDPFAVDGILYDGICLDARNFGMEGWTHGVWPGYSLDQWTAVDNSVDAYRGDWYYAVAGTGDYSATPTNAWLQTPEIDLSSYPEGQRLSFAFFHKYEFGNAGDGCNVLISDDNGATWNLIAPYWGYYTSSVEALGEVPGWTGQNGGWGGTGAGSYDFSVFDISEYAGKTVRVRFNYATSGASSNGGWQIDYCRSRVGPDWPQIDLGGGGHNWKYGRSLTPEDPSSTPYGNYWVGNAMSTTSSTARKYFNNQDNCLLSPPVCYDNDTGAGIYSYIEFHASPRTEANFDFARLEVAAYGQEAPSYWHELCKFDGSSSGFTQFRYRLDELPELVWTGNQTVIFRWRMTSDGSVTAGGWNIDNIKCFTSDSDLPDLFDGSTVLDVDESGENSEVNCSTKPFAPVPPTYHGQFTVAPLDVTEEQKRLEGR